jgi:hypothetical protein
MLKLASHLIYFKYLKCLPGYSSATRKKFYIYTVPLPNLNMEIIWRGSREYEEARVGKLFNLRRPDRYPLAIVIAKNETDIIKAVVLAHEKGTRIAVRSGGHSFAVWSVRNDSILLDLTNYNEVEVDVENQMAYVSPSTRSNVDSELMHKYGLIFGGGHCPDVGLGGYLLQAGFGWNCKVGHLLINRESETN